ncbi:MAG: hypothetical protein JNK87_08735 [Bryobacterales bacterium]|nr:hypothetical protein [Bryobacterales bacterium]
MPLRDWIAKPWPELVQAAEEAFANQDIVTLLELDPVIRDRFLGILKRRESVAPFVSSLLEILATPDAAAILADADEISKLVAQWELLARLAESEERTRDLERNAVERHVTGRPRRQQIFDLLAARTEIRFQEMKAELGVGDANLSQLLSELEAHSIVERERRGTETWVRLGSAGKAHLGTNVVELRLPAHQAAIASVLPEDDWQPLPVFTATA